LASSDMDSPGLNWKADGNVCIQTWQCHQAVVPQFLVGR
jgi:hypothetical protein